MSVSDAMPVTTQYITTDLEFDGPVSLARVVAELGDDVVIHLDERDGDGHRVALGIGVDDDPERSVACYCSLLERLSPAARRAWDQCVRRVLDIAFEGGTTPLRAAFALSPALLARTVDLKLGIVITIYRVGAYSDEDDDRGP